MITEKVNSETLKNMNQILTDLHKQSQDLETTLSLLRESFSSHEIKGDGFEESLFSPEAMATNFDVKIIDFVQDARDSINSAAENLASRVIKIEQMDLVS